MGPQDYIAVFDSGVGGLSVLKALLQEMPGENFLYFGDSANAPYGEKSTQEVKRLTMAAAQRLLERGVKALVLACNTATAAAVEELRSAYPDVIIIGIEPALKLAVDRFPTGKIGVMATPVTLREEKFHQQLHRFPDAQVTAISAPGLVELIEEGHQNDKAVEDLLAPILSPYYNQLDAVVLGCTHYPFAAKTIGKLLGEKTLLLDGGEGTARQARRRLEEENLLLEGEGSVQMENSAQDVQMLAYGMALLEEN